MADDKNKNEDPEEERDDLFDDDEDLEKNAPDGVEKTACIDQDPVHEVIDPLIHGDEKFFRKFKHFDPPGPPSGLPESCFR